MVVGSRDPIVSTTPGVHQIELPFQANGFMETVRGLLATAPTDPMVLRVRS